MLRKVNRVTHPRPLTRHELIIISNQNKKSVNAITQTAQATQNSKSVSLDKLHSHKVTSRHATKERRNNAWHAISTNGKTQPAERFARLKFLAHCNAHFDRLFTRDNTQKWLHELSRAAGNKEFEAFTKLHSYLDEFIPF